MADDAKRTDLFSYTSELFGSSENAFELHSGDCLELLPKMPSRSFDLIFADPPYNLSNNGTTCYAGKRVSVNKGEWDRSRGLGLDHKFYATWIGECKRLLKPTGTLWISGTYHNIFICGFVLAEQEWHLLNDIIWYKPNAAPNLACRMFTASHETLLWARPGKNSKHYFDYDAMKNGSWENTDFLKRAGKQMRSVWALGPPKSEEKAFGKHPTQKPLALLERIVKASCPVGGAVLDPFCGSGTTGVAALKHGARFVGIDKESEYIEGIAKPRLDKQIRKL